MFGMKTITFVTANPEKISDIKSKLGKKFNLKFNTDINLLEIQSLSVEEVVSFKVKQAFDIIKEPVVVSDSGLEIVALKNFPGALVKFANEYLGQEGIVKLLEGKENRKAYFVAAIAYCDSSNNVQLFITRDEGSIAHEPKGEGWHFDRIFIPLGENKTWAEIGRGRKNESWAFGRILNQLVEFLEKE
ncbi:MAG: non-canonical purine NTP pyrophosphatase [Candidatus Heimdallarchaeota archaeon]|nr:non-canonical purine NTP pyrophosphatase [Candidatus Heimdallarchaeota archaeon]